MKTEKPKVTIVGVGFVGGTYAFNLMLSGLAREILLIDRDEKKVQSQAMDLNHGLSFTSPASIHAGSIADCSGSDLIVITAGASQRPGQTRLDLGRQNVDMFKTIVPEIARTAPDSILLVVTNPVDVLTYAALRFSGFEPGRVIGSGTVLDSARFRYLIAERCGVDVRNVHAHIIGEHGDTELPVWSSANIGGVRFNQYCAVCGEGCDFRREFEPVFEEVRTSAYKIIAAKGATYYAIATALVKITSAILRNENSVLSVSRLIDGYLGIRDVCIGIPSIVNKAGATKQLELDLSTEEREAFIHSARMIRQAIDDLGIERATAGAGAQRTK